MTCQRENRDVIIQIALDYCNDHEESAIKGVYFDSAHVPIEQVVPALLSVIEQIIAAKYASDPTTALGRLVRGEYPDGKLDATEQPRLANYIANRILSMAVQERNYAQVAQFHLTPDAD